MGRLDLFVSLAGAALVVCLALLLVLFKLYKKYPVFFAYTLFSVTATIIGFSARNNYQIYFKVFWATEAIHAVLALLALHEAFRSVFAMDYQDWPWFWMVFPAAVTLLSAVFIGDTLLHPPAQASPIVALILSFGTVVNCVKGGLFVLFAILAWILLGQTWPTYPFGVVFGFAVSALGSGTAYWMISIFGNKFNSLGKYGPPVAYILAVLIWIGSCFLPPEPEKRWTGLHDPEEALATMRQYLKALNRIMGKK